MSGKTRSVLFISNCQSLIYEKVFSMLIAEELTFQVISTNNIDSYNERISQSEFNTIIGPSSILNNEEFKILLDGSDIETLVMEPFLFESYHPDICYLKDKRGNLVKTKMGDYNSIIVLCGFLHGLTVEGVLELFDGTHFDEFGFYDLWNQDVQRLQTRNALNLNWVYMLREESRRGCFMFTFNHPNSSILSAIAIEILKELNIKYNALSSNAVPSYLANGPVWPIYPDIAERFAIKGDYFFKPADSWSVFDLRTFIEDSFEEYRKLGVKKEDSLVFGCGNRFERVMAVLEGSL